MLKASQDRIARLPSRVECYFALIIAVLDRQCQRLKPESGLVHPHSLLSFTALTWLVMATITPANGKDVCRLGIALYLM